MINKNLLNKKVIKALSIGLSTAMIMQPVASMAEEAPATETPDGFVVKVVEEKPVEETEFFEETPDFFEEAEAVDELLDEAEFKETVAGAEAVLSFEVPVILNEVAAVIDDTQAEEKLADTEELVADAQDEITAKIDEVEEDLEEREKVIDNAKNLADEANAAAQKVQDDVDDADALLAEAEAAKTSAEAAAISEEIKDLADDAEAQAAIAEAKAEEAEAAIEEAKQMYEDAEAKYNEAVEYAAAKVEEANALLAEGTEDAKDAWIDAQRALNAARALQATTNLALKGAEAYVSTVEKELIDAKLELLQAQADLKQAAADKVSADLKVVAEGIDLLEATALLDAAKAVVKLGEANVAAKEQALQDLYDKKTAADEKLAELEATVESAEKTWGTNSKEYQTAKQAADDLATAIATTEKAITDLKGDIATAKKDRKDLVDEFKDARKDLASEWKNLYELTDEDSEKKLLAAEKKYADEESTENLEALIIAMLEKNYNTTFVSSELVKDGEKSVFVASNNPTKGYTYSIDDDGKVDVFEQDINFGLVRSEEYVKVDDTKYGTEEDALAAAAELGKGIYVAEGNNDAEEEVIGHDALYDITYTTEEEVILKKAGTIEDDEHRWFSGYDYKNISPDDLPEGATVIVRTNDLEFFGFITGKIKGIDYYTYTYTLIPDGKYEYKKVGTHTETKSFMFWSWEEEVDDYGWVWVDTSYYAWVCDQTGKKMLSTDHVSLLYTEDVKTTETHSHDLSGVEEKDLGQYNITAKTKTAEAVEAKAAKGQTYTLKQLEGTSFEDLSKEEFDELVRGMQEGYDYIASSEVKTTKDAYDEEKYLFTEVDTKKAKEWENLSSYLNDSYQVTVGGHVLIKLLPNGKYLCNDKSEYKVGPGQEVKVEKKVKTGEVIHHDVETETIYSVKLFSSAKYELKDNDGVSDFNQSVSKLTSDVSAQKAKVSEAKDAKDTAKSSVVEKSKEIAGYYRELKKAESDQTEQQGKVESTKNALDVAKANEEAAKSALDKAKAAQKAAQAAYDGYYNNGFWFIIPSSYELDVKAANAKVTQAEIELGLAQAAKKLAQDNYDESVKEFNAAVKASEQALVELVKAELRRDADILVVAGKEIKLAGAKSAYNAAKNANDYALRLKADAKAARDAAKAAYDAYKALSVEDISAEELAAAKAAYEAAKLDYDFKLAAAKEATKLAEGAKKDYEDALEQVGKLAEQERLAAEEAARLAEQERLAAEEAARLAAETNTAEAPAAEEVVAIATTGAATTTTTTTTTTAQVVEIEDEDTALAEAPEEEEEVVLSIDEEGTPLAGDIEYLDLEEEEVPQAPAPEGSMSWWWLFIIAALGATGFEMYRRYNLKKTAKANKNNK